MTDSELIVREPAPSGVLSGNRAPIRRTPTRHAEVAEAVHLMDPIAAYEAEAERYRLAIPMSRRSAEALAFVPTDTPWVSTGPLHSYADGALDQPAERHAVNLDALHQTVRVAVDGDVEYGVTVGPHDNRITRVFVR